MTRCSWCRNILWPWQEKSGSMHLVCARKVERIRERDRYTQMLDVCRVCGVMPTANRNLICNTCAANAAIRARQEERL